MNKRNKATVKPIVLKNLESVSKAQLELNNAHEVLYRSIYNMDLNDFKALDLPHDQLEHFLLVLFKHRCLHKFEAILETYEKVPEQFPIILRNNPLIRRYFLENILREHGHLTNKLGSLVVNIISAYFQDITYNQIDKLISIIFYSNIEIDNGFAIYVLNCKNIKIHSKFKALLFLKQNDYVLFKEHAESISEEILEFAEHTKDDLDPFYFKNAVKLGLSEEIVSKLFIKTIKTESVFYSLRDNPIYLEKVKELVLLSTSISAITKFYRIYPNKCDKKEFAKRISELVTPDPIRQAESILEGKGGFQNPFSYPYGDLYQFGPTFSYFQR